MLERFLPQTTSLRTTIFTQLPRHSALPVQLRVGRGGPHRLPEPQRIALVWCDEKGDEATFTFGQMRELSLKAAALFLSLGIGRETPSC